MASLKLPRALTIAGFDPSGGAGVLADVRTFAAFGFRAAAAITSLTFQNSSKVFGAEHQSGESVRSQVMPLLAGGQQILCVKTGMLPTRDVVLEVARLFRESKLPRPVVDPVITASSGHALMEESALTVLIEVLFPLAELITPNIPEAEKLTGMTITSESDMRQAAILIREQGARAVLVKGGHLKQDAGAVGRRQETIITDQDEAGEAIDVLDNQGKVTVFRKRRISGGELHGSGCILSAAIAAGLGKRMTLEDSVGAAKSFVYEAIREASIGS